MWEVSKYMLIYLCMCIINLLFLLIGYSMGKNNLEKTAHNIKESIFKSDMEEYEAVEVED